MIPRLARLCVAVLLLVASSCQPGSRPIGRCGPAPTTQAWVGGATAVSPTDVWAVGMFQGQGTAAMPFAEHWDGTRWSEIQAPAGPWTFGAHLSAAANAATDEVWAVGAGQNNGEEQTLIERWDGRQWSIVPSPNGSERTNELSAVSVVARGDVWAVGDYYDDGKQTRTLIEHWDGKAWSLIPGRDPGVGMNWLRGVAAVSTNDVWAVGTRRDSDDTAPRTLIEHWNGSLWTEVKGVDRGDSSSLSSLVALGADDVWAAGSYEAGGRFYPLVERWDGRSWTLQPGPDIHDVEVTTMLARSPSEVWLGGTVANSAQDGWLLERWDGSRWTRSAAASGTSGQVSGLVRQAEGAWAVGTYRDGRCGPDWALIQRWDGSRWAYVASPHDRAG